MKQTSLTENKQTTHGQAKYKKLESKNNLLCSHNVNEVIGILLVILSSNTYDRKLFFDYLETCSKEEQELFVRTLKIIKSYLIECIGDNN